MNQKEINKKSYNQIAKKWNEYRNNCTINTCIKDFCKLLPANSLILDIGCGTGYPIDVYLSKQGHTTIGIDISNEMIKIAKERNTTNTNYFLADFIGYEINDKFDAIIAFDSIWHIEESKQKEIYKKVSSLLKENGYFIFTHGKKQGTIIGEMFDNKFVYSALDSNDIKKCLIDNNMDIILWEENYKEETTGTRDLLVVAKTRSII